MFDNDFFYNVCDCIIGFIPGVHRDIINISSLSDLRFNYSDSACNDIIKHYFLHFHYCPICGKKICWTKIRHEIIKNNTVDIKEFTEGS